MKMKMIQLLLSFLCFILCASFARAGCVDEWTQKTNYISYQHMKECFQSLPLNVTEAQQVLQTVERSMQIHVFLDESKNSQVGDAGADFALTVDVAGEVNKMKTKEYAGEWAFYDDLCALFRSLEDGHTMFQRPLPYRQSFMSLPFPVYSRLWKGSQGLFVSSPSSDTRFPTQAIYESVYGEPYANGTTLTDWQIISIDGVDAVQAVKQWAAANTWSARDINGKFNYATLKNQWALRSFAYNRMPSSEGQTFKLRSMDGSQEIECFIRWIGVYLNPSASASSFFSSDTLNAPTHSLTENEVLAHSLMDMVLHAATSSSQQQPLSSSSSSSSSSSEAMHRPLSPIEQVDLLQDIGASMVWGISDEKRKDLESFYLAPPSSSSSSAALFEENELINNCTLFDFATVPEVTFQYLGVGDAVMVLVIKTFNPASPALFVKAVECAIANHLSKGGNKLIMDLRGNGGGYVNLGVGLVRYLFPNSNILDKLWLDMRAGAFLKQLLTIAARALSEDPLQWPDGALADLSPLSRISFINGDDDAQTRLRNMNESWVEGAIHQRGGNQQQFTQKFHFNFDMDLVPWSLLSSSHYSPNHLIVLCDGMSASTASIVSSFLHLNKLGRLVAMGGLAEEKLMQGWTVPGGAVTNLAAMIESAQAAQSLDVSVIPLPLPRSASLSFVYCEMYDWLDQSRVAEFTFHPASNHLLYEEHPSNSTHVYTQQLMPLFEECLPGTTDICLVPHGRGVLECAHGLVSDHCVATVCDENYFISGDQCLPPTAATSSSDFPVNGKTIGGLVGMFFAGALISGLVVWFLLRSSSRDQKPLLSTDMNVPLHASV
eukprot:TRINITY_DN77_c5_g1_i1.p1 TRINITY_DN77_c5_g1~~TRINITY_DN77_c5_g1_i1.p1  ORF type:complete len:830 (+),score=263.09 TRINITY_DN77_c5_g1_i1:112-2601(+)